MATDTDKLLAHIRALPEEERVRLLDALLTDLDAEDPEINQVWATEARKRWDLYKAGKFKTVSYDELVRRYKT